MKAFLICCGAVVDEFRSGSADFSSQVRFEQDHSELKNSDDVRGGAEGFFFERSDYSAARVFQDSLALNFPGELFSEIGQGGAQSLHRACWPQQNDFVVGAWQNRIGGDPSQDGTGSIFVLFLQRVSQGLAQLPVGTKKAFAAGRLVEEVEEYQPISRE